MDLFYTDFLHGFLHRFLRGFLARIFCTKFFHRCFARFFAQTFLHGFLSGFFARILHGFLHGFFARIHCRRYCRLPVRPRGETMYWKADANTPLSVNPLFNVPDVIAREFLLEFDTRLLLSLEDSGPQLLRDPPPSEHPPHSSFWPCKWRCHGRGGSKSKSSKLLGGHLPLGMTCCLIITQGGEVKIAIYEQILAASDLSAENAAILTGQFQVQVCLVAERAVSWQVHLSLVLKAFGPLIALMSWEWTNRNAANRHLELPGLKTQKRCDVYSAPQKRCDFSAHFRFFFSAKPGGKYTISALQFELAKVFVAKPPKSWENTGKQSRKAMDSHKEIHPPPQALHKLLAGNVFM